MTGFSNPLVASTRQAMSLSDGATHVDGDEQHAVAGLRFAIQELDRIGHGERRRTRNNAEFYGTKPMGDSSMTSMEAWMAGHCSKDGAIAQLFCGTKPTKNLAMISLTVLNSHQSWDRRVAARTS